MDILSFLRRTTDSLIPRDLCTSFGGCIRTLLTRELFLTFVERKLDVPNWLRSWKTQTPRYPRTSLTYLLSTSIPVCLLFKLA